jgi:hypothetical protein
MPTFDGGHYFLTALVPIRTQEVKDGISITSAVHALRKRLDMLPTAAQSPACLRRQSPFARNLLNHFVRLVIIDDVAYSGRISQNTLLAEIRGITLTTAQPQDHLTCPFLLLAVDFDAKSGADSERDFYLIELWNTMKDDLRQIFTFCEGFDSKVTDAKSFAAYLADCQLETTMSFNDYYADMPKLPAWPESIFKWGAILGGGAFVLGMVATLILFIAELITKSWHPWLSCAVDLTLIGVAILIVVVALAYVTLMAAGRKPFPTAEDSNLPSVLKSLHMQRVFTRFAIDSQMLAAGTDVASADRLYKDFSAFVAANKPADLGAPTQAPGVIGI